MNAKQVVLIVLAVLGGLVSLWALGMWLTHSMMMGGGMMGWMPYPAFGVPSLLLLGLAVVVVAIILLRGNRIK